jgi:hypothetical protein
MGVPILADDRITIGKAVDKPDQSPPDPDIGGTIASIPELAAFRGKCPLWAYILAEAAHNIENVEIPVTEKKTITTPRLGPVGGRSVAEVFLGLMFGDNSSYLSLEPNWVPPTGPVFHLKDLVKYALGQ